MECVIPGTKLKNERSFKREKRSFLNRDLYNDNILLNSDGEFFVNLIKKEKICVEIWRIL